MNAPRSDRAAPPESVRPRGLASPGRLLRPARLYAVVLDGGGRGRARVTSWRTCRKARPCSPWRRPASVPAGRARRIGRRAPLASASRRRSTPPPSTPGTRRCFPAPGLPHGDATADAAGAGEQPRLPPAPRSPRARSSGCEPAAPILRYRPRPRRRASPAARRCLVLADQVSAQLTAAGEVRRSTPPPCLPRRSPDALGGSRRRARCADRRARSPAATRASAQRWQRRADARRGAGRACAAAPARRRRCFRPPTRRSPCDVPATIRSPGALGRRWPTPKASSCARRPPTIAAHAAVRAPRKLRQRQRLPLPRDRARRRAGGAGRPAPFLAVEDGQARPRAVVWRRRRWRAIDPETPRRDDDRRALAPRASMPRAYMIYAPLPEHVTTAATSGASRIFGVARRHRAACWSPRPPRRWPRC